MKGALFFAGAMIVERLVSFFMLPLLTKTISPEEYAIWSQSIIFSGVLTPVVLLGFQTAIIKFFPLWGGREKLQDSVLLFMQIAMIGLLVLVSISVITFDRNVAALIFGQSDFSYYIPLLIGMLVSEVLFEFIIGFLRAMNRIRRASFYLLLKGVWRLGILMLVLSVLENGFYEAFLSFILFQLIITVLIYLRELKFSSIVKGGIGPGRPYWNEVLRFSLPLLPLTALTAINNFADRFFLMQFHGLEVVATYAAGFSLAAIIAVFYSILGFTLFPALSSFCANNDMESMASLMRKVLIVYLSLLLPFIVFMAVIGGDVLVLLSNENYKVSSNVLFLLSCNLGLFGFYQIALYPFLLKKESLHVPLFMGATVALNVIFNALLVPEYGMFGATLAGFISNSFLAGVFLYMSKQVIQWEFPWPESLRIMIRALLMGGVIWIAVQWFGGGIPIVLFMILIVAAIIYGLLDYFDKRASFFTVIRSL